jgi:Holliday junction resolvase RusA-like endonuclease
VSLTLDRRRVAFTVLGAAQTKGSAKAFVPKKWAQDAVAQGKAPRAIVTNDNPNAKAWEQRIATEAQKVGGGALFTGPVILTVAFHLPRPKSLPKRVTHHMTRPDCDKATRCVLDALTGVLYGDDGQVVELHVRKQFAELGAAPRADITLEEASSIAPEATAGALFTEALCDVAEP